MKTSTAPSQASQVILRSAIEVFARKGYAGTAVQEILDRVKLSKPTLYYHFENKAGLFRAVLDSAFDESFQLMQAAVAGQKTTEGKLVGVASALFRFTLREQDLMRLVFSSLFAARDEVPQDCLNPARRRRNFQFVVELVAAAQKEGDLDPQYSAEDLAHAILGTISHRIRTYLLSPRGRLDRELAERTVQLFLRGAQRLSGKRK